MKKVLVALMLMFCLQSCNRIVEDFNISITYTVMDSFDTIPKVFTDTYKMTLIEGHLPVCYNDGYRIEVKSNGSLIEKAILVYTGTHKVNVNNFSYTSVRKYKAALF